MVRHVLVLVLLQICFCFKLNMNLNNELINHLNELKLNSSHALVQVPIPGHYMDNHPARCVSTFSRELKNFLNKEAHNFTVADAKHKNLLQKLKANLRELGKDQVDDDQCTMRQLTLRGRNATWTRKYVHFLKKLNNSG